ncbi:hypothetical protein C2G38_2175951 [Gigaspora rosea]|uniref:Uncharacterized protein n=1 Tax=Gigaspora rosea TaxID=44941 RepID=A0A397VK30_9GLOM|nr:hypothetical protein C2G38_2175951 [Gigaspora rosea]
MPVRNWSKSDEHKEVGVKIDESKENGVGKDNPSAKGTSNDNDDRDDSHKKEIGVEKDENKASVYNQKLTEIRSFEETRSYYKRGIGIEAEKNEDDATPIEAITKDVKVPKKPAERRRKRTRVRRDLSNKRKEKVGLGKLEKPRCKMMSLTKRIALYLPKWSKTQVYDTEERQTKLPLVETLKKVWSKI